MIFEYKRGKIFFSKQKKKGDFDSTKIEIIREVKGRKTFFYNLDNCQRQSKEIVRNPSIWVQGVFRVYSSGMNKM